MTVNKKFDGIIIGGSYAGLSAAMALGRSLRKVLIIDSGSPCNATTPHSHNFLTQDGSTPLEISSIARSQVEKYDTVTFYQGIALQATRLAIGFSITTATGETFTGRKLILATGVKDELPDIPGFAECWGISIIHCPYCHGYEYHHQVTGILANGDAAFHYAQLVSNLTNKLTIFTNGSPMFSSEQTAKLLEHEIPVIEKAVVALEHHQGYLKNLALADGSRFSLNAMYAQIPFVQHSEIPTALGCEINEQGYIKIDTMYKTTVPGVFACGDNTSKMRSVANAVASGNVTGAVVNKELVEAQF